MMAERPSASPLATCDSEPIHHLGAIQPIGFLLTVSTDWLVMRASANVQAFLGVAHDGIVGQAIGKCLDRDLLHDIRGRLQAAAGVGVVERLFGRRLAADGPLFDIAVHQSGREIVLEFEVSQGGRRTALTILQSMVGRVERRETLLARCSEVVRQVRAFIGFDRVMVYRFDDDGAGEVMAESVKSGLSPYLGLRYPASDIPAQARALYERNFLRSIVDVDAAPVAVTPALSPEGEPLDLSMSILRSVSPIHLEYLRNMGVRASMSISILRQGRLWGLIACHHGLPRHVDFETRSTIELFGQMLSYLLEVREREEIAEHELRTRHIHDRIAVAFASPATELANLPNFLTEIADYIACDGIGIYHSGQVNLNGMTPSQEEFLSLLLFLNRTTSSQIFSTANLSAVFPPAADYVARAAGLLSIPISRTPRDYLVFFRREIERSVTWAGDPGKVAASGSNGVRLTPRKSFEAWRETVRHQCTPWSSGDLRAAEALRMTLVEVVLRLTEAAQADRIGAQHSQEILIAELNHRVRNILGLIRGLVTQSAAHTPDLRSFVDRLDERVQSLARAHDLLVASNWGAASLHSLLRTEIGVFDVPAQCLGILGPDILLTQKAFSAMALVVHELVTNARKHGALSTPAGRITVETTIDRIGNVAIVWREADGPIVSPPTRRGFGLTILEQMIPFEVRGMSSPRFLPDGFRLDLMLPATVAQSVVPPPAVIPVPDVPPTVPADVSLAPLLERVLLVEDNFLIAIDAEDMLLQLGAGRVDIVTSVTEALHNIAEGRVSFAVLDVNLGAETSLAVARTLLASKIPFVFATGYGDSLAMPADMARVQVINKPYQKSSLAKAMLQVLAIR